MQLAFELVDHIFSFLSDQRTLAACSKHPALSEIAKRHLYYHVVVEIRPKKTSRYAFTPHYLSKLVSETPRILHYVRILEIRAKFDSTHLWQSPFLGGLLEDFATTLLRFPVLESIMLTNQSMLTFPNQDRWGWPTAFKAALEDRLNLPTLEELHLGGEEFLVPISLLGSCKNIKHLSLSGSRIRSQSGDSTLPQLKSLTLCCQGFRPSLLAWIKLHITELQSLKYVKSFGKIHSELFDVCAGTLEKLELDLAHSNYCDFYKMKRSHDPTRHLPELSLILPNLRQLIIRTSLCLASNQEFHKSRLPAAAEAIKLFMSSARHLVLDIDIVVDVWTLLDVDLSPLAILGPASLSIPRIDLYFRTGVLSSAVTHAHFLSFLQTYEDIARSITEGVLFLHSEETVPNL